MILLVSANPQSTGWLQLDEEERAIRRDTEAYRDRIRIERCPAARPEDLIDAVREYKPTIVQFSGHGTRNGLKFQADDDVFEEIEVSGEALEDFFRGRGVKCVILNACYTEHQARHIANVVDIVVGTRFQLDDGHARLFSSKFYRGIARGLSVAEAFEDGEDAITMNRGQSFYEALGDLNQVLVENATGTDSSDSLPVLERVIGAGVSGKLSGSVRLIICTTVITFVFYLIWAVIFDDYQPQSEIMTVLVVVSVPFAWLATRWLNKRRERIS